MQDVSARIATRPIQLTTDGHRAYLEAVDAAFADEIDFAMLHKIYKSTQDKGRYSPAACLGCETKVISGTPDPKHISTPQDRQ